MEDRYFLCNINEGSYRELISAEEILANVIQGLDENHRLIGIRGQELRGIGDSDLGSLVLWYMKSMQNGLDGLRRASKIDGL